MAKNLFISNFKKQIGSIVWVLLFFCLFELATRLFWKPPILQELKFLPQKYRRLEPNYNYGYDTSQPFFYEKGDTFFLYPTEYRFFNEQSMKRVKKENGFRIFILGPSAAALPPEKNYSRFLEKFLCRKAPEIEWETVIISGGGVGSKRMLLYLKQAIEYEPDLLIIHPGGTNEYEDDVTLKYKNTMNSGPRAILYRSNFIVILNKILLKAGLIASLPIAIESEVEASNKEENTQRWVTQFDKNLSEMIELASKHKIPVILVGGAHRNPNGKTYADDLISAFNIIIKKHSVSKNVIHYVDSPNILLSHFPHKNNLHLFSMDNWHWGPRTHMLIAEEIAEVILEYRFCWRVF